MLDNITENYVQKIKEGTEESRGHVAKGSERGRRCEGEDAGVQG